MQFEKIKEQINAQVPQALVGEIAESHPKTLCIAKAHIVQVCSFLHEYDQGYFDTLSCLTGLDHGPDKNTMEVIYHLYSIPFNYQIGLSVSLNRNAPTVDSVSHLWKAADWHEREVYDLLGIQFQGHPDMRRILLPNDWEGYPLRKDYTVQESYHDIKVKY